MKNEILEEVWRVRGQISAECGHDLKNLAAMLRREEVKYGDRLVSHGPHQSKTATVTTSVKAGKAGRSKRAAVNA